MEETYEVEKIVRHRLIGNKVEYLVNWKGYGHKHNTWQPENTMDAPALLQQYWEKKAPKAPKRPKQTARKKPEISEISARTAQKKPATPARTARKPASLSTSQTSTRKRPSSAITTNTTTSTTTATPKKPKTEIKRPRVVPAVDDSSLEEPVSLISSSSSSSSSLGFNRPFSPLSVISDRSIERRRLTVDTNAKTVKENDTIVISPTTATSSHNTPTNIIHFQGQDVQVSSDFRQDWKNWDTEVNKIEKAKIRGSHGEYIFYLVIRWNDGTLSAHDSKQVLAKCPLKVLKFYEDQIASCYI